MRFNRFKQYRRSTVGNLYVYIRLLAVTESNIVTTQGQKWENPVRPGCEPQVRGHRRASEQRDQEEKEMDGASPQSVVRLQHRTIKYCASDFSSHALKTPK